MSSHPARTVTQAEPRVGQRASGGFTRVWFRLFTVRQTIKLGATGVRASGHVLRVRGDGAERAGKSNGATTSSELSYIALLLVFCLVSLTKPKNP